MWGWPICQPPEKGTPVSEAVEAMVKLRAEIETRLMGNDDYRALRALDRAIRDAGGRNRYMHSPVAGWRPRPSVVGAGTRSLIEPDPSTGGDAAPASTADADLLAQAHNVARIFSGNSKPSQADAAYDALLTKGWPMTTAELIEPVRARGATLNGDDATTSLSSTLSRDKGRFKSVRWNGKSCWWFANVETPENTIHDDLDDLLGPAASEEPI